MDREMLLTKVREACELAKRGRGMDSFKVLSNERGLHGYPLVEARYEVCCEKDGSHLEPVYGDDDPDEVLFEACEEAYEDGRLNGNGIVVYDRNERRYGVLLMHRLQTDTVPNKEGLAELAKKYDLPMAFMAYPNKPYGHGWVEPAYVVATCFIDDPARFDDAPDIVADMDKAEREWRAAPATVQP